MITILRRNLTALILKSNSNHVCQPLVYFSQYSKNLSTLSKDDHEIFNILVHKHNFAPEFASRIASKASRPRIPENAGLVLSFFREYGFSDYQLEKMVRGWPRFVSANIEQIIKPKINFFQEMGLSSDDIVKILSGHSTILGLSLKNNIIPSVSLLKRLLGSADAAARIIRLAPWVLTSNLENTMLPNVEIFKCRGVPMERILMILVTFPNVFLLKPELVMKSVEKVEEMGIDASFNSFIYAVRTIASMSSEAWELKLQGFRSLGFSGSDILCMFRKSPLVFAISMEKIKKIVELLLDTRKYTISSIVMCPTSLGYSIEKSCNVFLHERMHFVHHDAIKTMDCEVNCSVINAWTFVLASTTIDQWRKTDVVPTTFWFNVDYSPYIENLVTGFQENKAQPKNVGNQSKQKKSVQPMNVENPPEQKEKVDCAEAWNLQITKLSNEKNS